MTAKVSVGKYEVLASGTVITYNEDPLKFSLEDLTITIDFKSDEGDSRIEHTVEGKVLNLLLFNFDNPLGVSNTEPLYIGYIRDQNLYLNIRVHTMGIKLLGNRTVHYTWYLREPRTHG